MYLYIVYYVRYRHNKTQMYTYIICRIDVIPLSYSKLPYPRDLIVS